MAQHENLKLLADRIERILAGITEADPSRTLPIIEGGELRFKKQDKNEDDFRRRLAGFFLLAFVGGLFLFLAIGFVTNNYRPAELWSSILGPWAGYIFKAFFDPPTVRRRYR